MSRLVTVLSPGTGYALANGLAGAHYALFGARRRAVLANLAVTRPEATDDERRRAAREVIASYNRTLVEFFRLPSVERDRLLAQIEFVGLDHLTGALAHGRGVIVTSSHIGNWELGAVVLAHLGHHVHAVAGVQLGRWLSPAVRRAKHDLQITTVAPEDGYRSLFRALGRNEIVALMVDGDVYMQGTTVRFFGREVAWPSGPGVLAMRTGAPIICGYCARIGTDRSPTAGSNATAGVRTAGARTAGARTAAPRFRIVLEPPLMPEELRDAHALNAAVAELTQAHVAAHLEQWCMFRSFWNERAAT